ncbi:alpha/beta hydrolase family esterase [Aestuariibius sp. 2305UL40-4]|uniref:alpha/beta hydrolase family esterase n=1 Tax=Aestuariibius violaceus TaxID=3234132 RepID=UPI00345E7E82
MPLLKAIAITLVTLMATALHAQSLPQIDATPYHRCGGVDRPCLTPNGQYHIILPQGEGPFPAILYFHGTGGSGERVMTTFDNILVWPAIDEGYAVIAPTGQMSDFLDQTDNFRPIRTLGWAEGNEGETRNDSNFVREVLNDVAFTFPIDESRILTAGLSDGGEFAWYLACSDTDRRLRHFAPVAGTLSPADEQVRSRSRSDTLRVCQNSRHAFHLFHTHGRNDRVVPYSGAAASRIRGTAGVEDSVQTILDGRGCRSTDSATESGLDITRWTGCIAGQSYAIALHDGGHYIPRDWVKTVTAWHRERLAASGPAGPNRLTTVGDRSAFGGGGALNRGSARANSTTGE